MVKGTTKWFNKKKGYGFITYEEDGEEKDIFVHYTAVEPAPNGYRVLYENDTVEFDIVEGDKGPQASNVKIIERAPRPQYHGGYSGYSRFG